MADKTLINAPGGEQTTPQNTDIMWIEDAASKYISLANLKKAVTALPEKILAAKNGNNPTTILAGTKFYYIDSSGNITLVSVTSNQTFVWGVGGFPAISDNIWYLYYDGTNYGATTTKPAWDEARKGWYISDNKYLCRFLVSSSTVSQTGILQGLSPYNGLIKYAQQTKSGSVVTVEGLTVDVEGKLIEYIEDLTFSGTAGWRGVQVGGEVAGIGKLLNGALASNTNPAYTTTGIPTNQLDMYSIFDPDLNYCDYQLTADSYRLIAVYYTTGSAISHLIPIDTVPYTNIFVHLNGNQAFTATVEASIIFDTVIYDLNSEYNTGTGVVTLRPGVQKINAHSHIYTLGTAISGRKLHGIKSTYARAWSGAYHSATTVYMMSYDGLTEVKKVGETMAVNCYFESNTSVYGTATGGGYRDFTVVGVKA